MAWFKKTRPVSTENSLVNKIYGENKQNSNDSDTSAARMKVMNAISAVIENRRAAHRGARTFIVFAIIVYFGWAFIIHSGLNYSVIFLLAGAFTLANAGVAALHYRVNHGLYGTNEYEAREIIRFIIDHTDNIDFSQGLSARDMDLSSDVEKLGLADWEVNSNE